MNGFEVLETMHNSKIINQCSVFMVSSLTCIETIENCFKLGAKMYFTKPILKDKILETLKS